MDGFGPVSSMCVGVSLRLLCALVDAKPQNYQGIADHNVQIAPTSLTIRNVAPCCRLRLRPLAPLPHDLHSIDSAEFNFVSSTQILQEIWRCRSLSVLLGLDRKSRGRP